MLEKIQHITAKLQGSIDIRLISTFKRAPYNIYEYALFNAACSSSSCLKGLIGSFKEKTLAYGLLIALNPCCCAEMCTF